MDDQQNTFVRRISEWENPTRPAQGAPYLDQAHTLAGDDIITRVTSMAKLGQESQLYPGLQVSMAQEAPVQTQANQLYPGLQVAVGHEVPIQAGPLQPVFTQPQQVGTYIDMSALRPRFPSPVYTITRLGREWSFPQVLSFLMYSLVLLALGVVIGMASYNAVTGDDDDDHYRVTDRPNRPPTRRTRPTLPNRVTTTTETVVMETTVDPHIVYYYIGLHLPNTSYTLTLEDPDHIDYRTLAILITDKIDEVYTSSSLSAVYERSMVVGFSPYDVNVTIADGGTVDVDATVYTDIRLTLDKEDDNETFNYNDVRVTLKNAIRSGDLHSLAIEPDDKFWFYGKEAPVQGGSTPASRRGTGGTVMGRLSSMIMTSTRNKLRQVSDFITSKTHLPQSMSRAIKVIKDAINHDLTH